MNRIVVTGLGTINPIANSYPEFVQALMQGKNGIKPVTDDLVLYPSRTRIAAQIEDFQPRDYFSDELIAQLDRSSQLALVASKQAIMQAGLDFTEDSIDATRAGVIYGAGIGGQMTFDDSCYRLYHDGEKRSHPLTIPRVMPSASASHISMLFGIQGPTFAVSSACASSAHAICQAVMVLRSGMADIVVSGGAEAPLSRGSLNAWEGLRVLAKDTCRPFSAKRGGMVLAEGAASLVLETLAHAQKRGATILAEISGIGMSADASNLIRPEQAGMAQAMRSALSDAKIGPEKIAHINAHGTGTPQNDPVESAAIRQVFNAYADQVLVSSTKSMHGHVVGATAAIEALAAIAAIDAQAVPPTLNFIASDPLCDLNYVLDINQPAEIDHVLSNSFAFGGLNSSLLFSRYKGQI